MAACLCLHSLKFYENTRPVETTTNAIEAIFTPPQGGLKTNKMEHESVLYYDILLLNTQYEDN